MIFNAKPQSGRTAGRIHIFYLTQGATWAPSYRVKLLDDRRLTLEQSTVILNEWMPINDAEIALVSGFPQIEMPGVITPLHPSQTLRQFLAQMRSPQSAQAVRDASGPMGQAPATMPPVASSPQLPPPIPWAPGEGPDIHYHSIGKRTLEINDALALTTGKGEATYERVMNCDLSALVLNFWRQNSQRGANIQINNTEVFEVLKFNNPLGFPMTTAPVTITDTQRFLGQSMTNWVGTNQPATVNITKVMNVSISYSDELDLSRRPDELPPIPNDSRQIPILSGFENVPLWSVGVLPNSGNRFRLIPILGTLEITNNRNEAITLHLTSAAVGVVDLDKRLIAESDVAVKSQTILPVNREFAPNSVSRLYWELTLQPGEKKSITVRSSRWVLGM